MKEMKKIILLAISLSLVFSLNSQTAKEVFLSMPENMLPDLSVSARMDLMDLYEADRTAIVINSLDDTLSLETLTADYLFLNTGKGSLQIVVLPMINESQLYCFIQTVCGSVCDSRIEFYSPSWKKLNADAFITPAPQTWFIRTNEDFPALTVSFMQWSYDPESSTLQQINRTPEYLSKEDRKMIQSYIEAAVKKYQWTGVRFE
jgi:hypothetical protein